MLTPDAVIHDRYRIVRPIGQGGFGAVYEAIDLRLNRRVALKQLLRPGDRLSRQFTHEAQVLANLNHPALPRVTDHFIDDAGQFLVMDYIAGDDLATLLSQRNAPFSLDQVLQWGDQLLGVLHYLHTRQPPIVHRDIKPQNLKLRDDGTIMLLDFGLAKGGANAVAAPTTESSILAYTKGYAPLEQVRGLGTDARSDLYSLGATLYCLLTNTPPVEAELRAYAAKLNAPDDLQTNLERMPQVPVPVRELLLNALAVDPQGRPPSAEAMHAQLLAAQSTRRGARSPTATAGTSPAGPTELAGWTNVALHNTPAPAPEATQRNTPAPSINTRANAPDAVPRQQAGTQAWSGGTAGPPARKTRLWGWLGGGVCLALVATLAVVLLRVTGPAAPMSASPSTAPQDTQSGQRVTEVAPSSTTLPQPTPTIRATASAVPDTPVPSMLPDPTATPVAVAPPMPTTAPTETPPPIVASALVRDYTYTGACPTTFRFAGEIRMSGPGTVRYQWDGSRGPTEPETLSFETAGTKTVSLPVSVEASRTGWIMLRILAPNQADSPRVDTALTCTAPAAANAVVRTYTYDGPCPTTFRFEGEIEMSGPGTVRYQWDGSRGPTEPETLTFAAAGRSTVSLPVTVEASRTGWIVLRILTPNVAESPRVDVTLQCNP